MEASPLLIPFFGMLVLTFVVWVYMYIRRIGYMLANKIPAHAGATTEKMRAVVPEHINRPAYNLVNLFELPVLFYAICLYLLWSNKVDDIHVMCAYVFFIGRSLHSLIQCSVNHVMARFLVYMVASIALWVMLIRAALAL